MHPLIVRSCISLSTLLRTAQPALTTWILPQFERKVPRGRRANGFSSVAAARMRPGHPSPSVAGAGIGQECASANGVPSKWHSCRTTRAAATRNPAVSHANVTFLVRPAPPATRVPSSRRGGQARFRPDASGPGQTRRHPGAIRKRRTGTRRKNKQPRIGGRSP